MSNDKNEKPSAGHNPHKEYDRDGTPIKPIKGETMVRQADGTAMLGQTDKTFGKGWGHYEYDPDR